MFDAVYAPAGILACQIAFGRDCSTPAEIKPASRKLAGFCPVDRFEMPFRVFRSKGETRKQPADARRTSCAIASRQCAILTPSCPLYVTVGPIAADQSSAGPCNTGGWHIFVAISCFMLD